MPAGPSSVYLDHHATTPVDERVLEVMLPFFRERFGNPASINHGFGTEAAEAVETARNQVAALLQAEAREIIFTSGATEANNLAIKGVMQSHGVRPDSHGVRPDSHGVRPVGLGGHLITAAAEHRAVLDPAKRLARAGFDVTILPVDEFGRVSPQQVAEAIQPATVLVSIMAANNEIGTLNPIAEIGRICRERNVLFHTDAVQAAAHLPLDVTAWNVDLLSLSAHKLYGPKGVGALFVRRGEPRIVVEPQIDGGGHERRLRSGTLPVPLIVGFGEACRLAEERCEDGTARLRMLRDRLWNELNTRLEGLHLNGHPEDRLPNNLNVSFEGVDGEALMTGLKWIAVSSGSACTSADPEPSHVLRAIGRNDQLTRASLRFGLGRPNTAADIDTAVKEVTQVVRRLRG